VRPDPDDLLAQLHAEAQREARGGLTVFFGAAAGVGKTYAMLAAAQAERALGRDVVVGIVETHGRQGTATLAAGLEILPRCKLEHRTVMLEELDLDAALARSPSLLLVDELAHTNAPGSRHKKRWQDIEELRDAGIDVYTTVNVQHLESLNDVIAQITGVVVRETFPDRIFEQADEIRLVDLPPDELIERLREGKIYMPDQARRALTAFFKKGTLTALRELALRQTAERVDEQMRLQKRAEGIEPAWPVAERILVCVSASPAAARLIRAARRMAASARAEWIAVHVETGAALRMSEIDRERVAQNLRLAEALGADTVRLSGASAAEEVIAYARKRNVTKIVCGKPTHPRWREVLQQSFLEEVVRGTPDIDVHVITGEGERARSLAPAPRARLYWRGYAAAVLAIAAVTTLAWLLFGRAELADVLMLYLFGIVLVSMRFGYGPSILAAVLGVASLLTFGVPDLGRLVTFAVMLFVALVIGRLTKRLRDQADTARKRELRSKRLYAMSRELASASSLGAVLGIAAKHLGDAFDAEIAVLVPDPAGKLVARAGGPGTFALGESDASVADWVWAHGKAAGRGTDTLPSAGARALLLRAARAKVGVLALRVREERAFVDPEQELLLETFASQIASSLERVRLAEEAQRSEVAAESERLRSSLLSSVSHDLRTPLAVITGATSTLLDHERTLEPSARRDLLETAHEEAERLSRLVRNLLDMTRIASGAIHPKKEWHPLDAVIGAALHRLDARLAGRRVELDVPADLPPIALDPVLVEQLVVNLLENALNYTPRASSIEIRAGKSASAAVEVAVLDRGRGVPAADKERVFEKFYSLRREDGGAGLGLAICRGVVEAHGGRIWVEDREGGGAIFRFTLPVEETALVLADSADESG
jgi:two-component system sensor histidine kinase KdpD